MEIDFISSLHKSTKRNYLARVKPRYPKIKQQSLQKNGVTITGMVIER